MQDNAIAAVSSAIAAQIIKQRLEAGGTIEIPSLGITIGGKTMTPEIDSAILDLIDSFKTFGAYLQPGQEPPVLVAQRALIEAIATALQAERERAKADMAAGLHNAAFVVRRDGGSEERARAFEDAAAICASDHGLRMARLATAVRADKHRLSPKDKDEGERDEDGGDTEGDE